MKAERQGTKAKYGFEVPAAGRYLWEIGGDISIFMKDEVKEGNAPGPKSLMIPLTIFTVIEGEAEVGQKATLFIQLVKKTGEENSFGCRQMMSVIEAVGEYDALEKKMGDKEIDPTTSPQFAQFLATHLPGKIIKATHEVGEDAKGNKQVRFTETDIADVDAVNTNPAPDIPGEDPDDWS